MRFGDFLFETLRRVDSYCNIQGAGSPVSLLAKLPVGDVECFQVTTVANGVHGPYVFCGIDQTNVRLALRRSLSELLEFQLMEAASVDWSVSRSGFATHLNSERAFESAKIELIERDAFLTSLLVPSLKGRTRIYNPRFKKHVFVELHSVDLALRVVLSGLRFGDGRGWYLGLGTSRNLDEAVLKSAIEASMIESSFEATVPDGPIANDRKRTLRIHLMSSIEEKVKTRIENLFFGETDSDFRFSLKPHFNKLLERQNFNGSWTVRVVSEDLLPLTFGKYWTQSELEIRRRIKLKGLHACQWMTHPLV